MLRARIKRDTPINISEFIAEIKQEYPQLANITNNHIKKELLRLKDMKRRCYDPKNKDFKRYGGRGIKICDEWLNDKKSFVVWALTHNSYLENMSIDRIDADGDYEPKNCQFITIFQNCTQKQRYGISNANFRYYRKYGGLFEFQYNQKVLKGGRNFMRTRRLKGWTLYESLNVPNGLSRKGYWELIDSGKMKPSLEVFVNRTDSRALDFYDEYIIKCPKCGKRSLYFNKKIGAKCNDCDFIVKIRSEISK